MALLLKVSVKVGMHSGGSFRLLHDGVAATFLPSAPEFRFHWPMEVRSLPDAALVARCRRGDQQAWCELVERFSRYVYAIATQGFRLNDADAEDVFQEVFARTYEHLDRLRDDGAIQPWLAQMTRRLAIDRLRAAKREQVAAEIEPAGVDETLERLDDAMAVHEGLAELSDECREILDRFFARDESYRTIGEDLSLPAGTVASRISRCLGKLRDQFEGRKPPRRPSGGR